MKYSKFCLRAAIVFSILSLTWVELCSQTLNWVHPIFVVAPEKPKNFQYFQGDPIRFYASDSVTIYNGINNTIFGFFTKLEGPEYYYAYKPFYVDDNYRPYIVDSSGKKDMHYQVAEPRVNRNNLAFLGEPQSAGLYQIKFQGQYRKQNKKGEKDKITDTVLRDTSLFYNLYVYSGYSVNAGTESSTISSLAKKGNAFTRSLDSTVDLLSAAYQHVNDTLLNHKNDSIITASVNASLKEDQSNFRYDLAIIYAKNEHLLLCVTGDTTTIADTIFTNDGSVIVPRKLKALAWPASVFPQIFSSLSDTSISTKIDSVTGNSVPVIDRVTRNAIVSSLQQINVNPSTKVQHVYDPGFMLELLHANGIKDDNNKDSFYRLIIPKLIHPQIIFLFRFQHKAKEDD